MSTRFAHWLLSDGRSSQIFRDVDRSRAGSGGSSCSRGELAGNSLFSVVASLSVVSEPLSALGVLVHSGIAWGNDGSAWFLVSGFLRSSWLGDDGGVDFLV